jgi:hypothetical protein
VDRVEAWAVAHSRPLRMGGARVGREVVRSAVATRPQREVRLVGEGPADAARDRLRPLRHMLATAAAEAGRGGPVAGRVLADPRGGAARRDGRPWSARGARPRRWPGPACAAVDVARLTSRPSGRSLLERALREAAAPWPRRLRSWPCRSRGVATARRERAVDAVERTGGGGRRSGSTSCPSARRPPPPGRPCRRRSRGRRPPPATACRPGAGVEG